MDGTIPEGIPVAEQDGYLRGWQDACLPSAWNGAVRAYRDMEARCIVAGHRDLADYCRGRVASAEMALKVVAAFSAGGGAASVTLQ